jgi:energy-coupling factor transport system ATP-binding protein
VSAAAAPVLRLEGVTYAYPGAGGPALRDVSLEVGEGELVVVAGASAGGKSTLLRAAAGLVPHFHGGVFAGRATVGGLDTRRHGPAALAAVAGSLFQDPETQVVLGTVRAELAFPLENLGAPPAAIARGVEEVALALGVERLLDRAVPGLSGGELQRVALGAALVARPRLLLLDEPTSQLDPVAGDELLWLLRRLNEEWGTTVLLAEHRLERCLPHADRLLVLEDGRLACDGAPRDVLAWAAEHDPVLLTPAARLLHRAGLRPPPRGVKDARATLRAHGLLPAAGEPPAPTAVAPPSGRLAGGRLRRALGRASAAPPAVAARGVWHELRGGAAILRGVDLALAPGERVALLGRNGAGKSTLLRHLAGLQRPTRGRVEAAGRVGLLLQNPGDYLVHERASDEASLGALAAVGLEDVADRHPRDLSGGERQRLALAVVLDGEDGPAPPVALLLDEPTRGMDRGAKAALATRLRRLAAAGAAVLVATHDVEFAAAFAERAVLLADGRPIADGPVAELLAGGWHFATETARVLGGAGGALTPDEGAALLRARLAHDTPPHDTPPHDTPPHDTPLEVTSEP